MIQFLKDIVKILTFLFVVAVSCLILTRQANTNILNSNIFSFKSDVYGVIIGDSHPMTSLNPALLPSFVNFSQAGENYFYSYYKLRLVLEKNPQIKMVVLGFSYHNLVFSQDRSLKDPTYTNIAFDIYSCMLDKDAKSVIWHVNKNYLPDYLKYEYGIPFDVYKNNMAIRKRALFEKTFSDADRAFFGGYYRGNNTMVSDHMIDDYIRDIYYQGNDQCVANKSDISVEYLHKIIDMCAKKKIRVVLFNAPLHPHLLERIPAWAKELFAAAKKEVQVRYPTVELLDFTSMRLADSMYGDADHVNGVGSDIVTKCFLRHLPNNIAEGSGSLPLTTLCPTQ